VQCNEELHLSVLSDVRNDEALAPCSCNTVVSVSFGVPDGRRYVSIPRCNSAILHYITLHYCHQKSEDETLTELLDAMSLNTA
jgi:hypothetical protein